MKIGLFGGSFDPIHIGHLLLAECCREQAGLDQVLFAPAAQSPLKSNPPLASDRQRTEMIMLAIGGHEQFELSTAEIDRGAVSFTVDTLEVLSREHSSEDLFLIIGADSLASFAEWKDPGRICELAIPIVVARRGFEASVDRLAAFMSDERLELAKRHQVEFPLIEISSTEIREAVRAGKSIRYRTPRSVEMFITTQCLYTEAKSKC